MAFLFLLASAAAVGAAPPASSEAATTCSKPVLIESPTVTPTVMNSQMQQAQAYVDCMSKAIEVQRTLAEQTLQTAQAAAQKTNAMITEVNDFVAKVKSYQEEHSGN